MKDFFVIFVLALFTTINSFAVTNKTSLKGGVSYTSANIEGLEGTEDDMRGIGFNTHFGHKWKYFEVDLSSYIYWGNIDDLTFQANGESIMGSGSFRHVSFGPVLKYHTQYPKLFKNWTPFIGLGPVWSLQTVKFDNFTSSGSSFNSDQKLTFESFGGLVVVGLQEQLKNNEAHPVFVEFMYSYKKARKVVVVDASDSVETEIISTEKGQRKLNGHFFMVSVGMTIF